MLVSVTSQVRLLSYLRVGRPIGRAFPGHLSFPTKDFCGGGVGERLLHWLTARCLATGFRVCDGFKSRQCRPHSSFPAVLIYMALSEAIIARFISLTLPAPPSECVLWMAGCTGLGYGQFCFDGEVFYAHRVAWEIVNGPIPDGLLIRHSCDVTTCVNGRHLLSGNQKQNMQDKMCRGRHVAPGGERNGRTTLTSQQVREFRRLHAEGKYNQSELGRKYGVSSRTASAIIRRETWKYEN